MSFHFRCVLISPNEILPKLCFSKTSSFVTHVEGQRAVVKGIFYFVRCALLLHTLWKWKWASGFIIVAHLLLQLQFTCEEEGLPVELKMVNQISCDQCLKTFTSRQRLSRHRLSHSGEMIHKCAQCNKLFGHASNLKKHLHIHTGEKPHKCTQCNFSANQFSNLERHKRTHSGEKPQRCTMCQFFSITTGHLKVHMMMKHTGEKPHKCDQCNYTCTTAGNLQRHMLTHTGEKLFKCNQCGKTYTRQNNLTKHLKTHITSDWIWFFTWTQIRLFMFWRTK